MLDNARMDVVDGMSNETPWLITTLAQLSENVRGPDESSIHPGRSSP